MMDEVVHACEEIRIGPHALAGEFELPPHAIGLVVFSHGSGSSRLSPRNRAVARALHAHGLGTLQFDLLDPAEAHERDKCFDIALLAARLGEAVDWLLARPGLRQLRIGLFGASTGAAAALRLAALRPGPIGAVVSRGGRPDLVAAELSRVVAPTLLIVGGLDTQVLELHRRVWRRLHCAKRLEIVPGATHLFSEPGTLDAVAHLAAAWFETHLARRVPL